VLPRRADVVVVGGGSCGSVVATRLGDDPDRSVLLIESGRGFPSLDDVPDEILDVATVPVGPGSEWTSTYPTRLSPGAATVVSRGRVLGGSGAVNGAYFVRARDRDLDSWPHSWSYERVLPSFREIETDADFRGREHGDAGPIPVSRVSWERLQPVSGSFHAAAAAVGHTVVDDLNAPGPDGVGRVPLNVRDGVRTGPGRAHLQPALGRPQLTVAADHRVLRIVVARGRARGVDVADRRGAVHRVDADHVVLCAGAVCSPQLLMLSGIGPADELRRLGIEVRHDLPGVGGSSSDHPEVTIRYRYRTAQQRPPGSALLETVLHTGPVELRPYTVPFGSAVPGSGVHDPVLGVVLTRPRSRGRIVLDPHDPSAPPTLDQRYLADPADRDDLRAGVRAAVEVLARMGDVLDVGSIDPDAAAPGGPDDRWLTAHLGTSVHLSSTCRMGDDDGAVVDDRCRVRGIEGLSVVDTSVFPQVPSRGPHATAVMLAHRVAGRW